MLPYPSQNDDRQFTLHVSLCAAACVLSAVLFGFILARLNYAMYIRRPGGLNNSVALYGEVTRRNPTHEH